VAVVKQVADADVAQAIELRADLTELAAHELVVEHHVVRAHGSEALRNSQAEMARAEDRHRAFVRASELVDVARRDEALGLEHFRRREAIGGAALIGRAPTRWKPIVVLTERETSRAGRKHDSDEQNCTSSAHRFPFFRTSRVVEFY
jgi:hypothetical protein